MPRGVHLLLKLLDTGGSWEHTLTLGAPLGRDRLIEALSHRLADFELGGALASLTMPRVALVEPVAETARQERLLQVTPPQERRHAPMVEGIRQLVQRYGTSPLYRVVVVEPRSTWSRIPERRYALVSYDP